MEKAEAIRGGRMPSYGTVLKKKQSALEWKESQVFVKVLRAGFEPTT